jgi:hypothetical protein
MKPFIYDQLRLLDYDSNCPCLDTEWLLSTLFDASLLLTLAAGNGGFFSSDPAPRRRWKPYFMIAPWRAGLTPAGR